MADRAGGPGRVMAGLARGVIEAAHREGCDLGDVLDRFAVDPRRLDRADAFVSVELHEALWEEAARRTGRPDFGLFAAQHFRPGLTGVVEYHMRSCADVAEAVASWVRFAPVVSDCLSASVDLRAGGAPTRGRSGARSSSDVAILVWRLARPPSEGTRQWAEFALGRAVRLVRDAMASEDAAPAEVWFRHAAPADTTRHRALFLAPVRFAQPEHALVFPAALLDHPIRGFDPLARASLADRAETLRSEHAAEPELAARCRAVIRALLSEPTPDAGLPRVAERLGLSVRSLQRRLRLERVSFRELCDDVRQTEVERLLGRLSLHEVAARLGYGDDAALRKARKRWARRAPGGAGEP